MFAQQPATITTVDAKYAKKLIITQLERLIYKHIDNDTLKIALRKIIDDVEKDNSTTPLLTFKNTISSGNYILPDFIRKNLLNFVEMELNTLNMEPVQSNKLNSQEILGYIHEGREHAEKAKNLDLVIFVGNTGAGKSTMINALDGCKLVWGKYFKDVSVKGSDGFVEYEEETLFDLPEIRKLDNSKILELKARINARNKRDTVDFFLADLRDDYQVKITDNMRSLVEKAFAQPNTASNIDKEHRRVMLVDDRGAGKKAITTIGHSLKSCTFYPSIVKGEHMVYTDCPGFADNRTKEIEVANSVNIMQAVSQAKSVKVVILINYYSLKADRSKGLSDLWGIIQNLFGDSDNVLTYRESILINISHVPEVNDPSFPNTLKGICNILQEKPELIPLLDRVIICDPLDRSLSEGTISLAECSNKIKALQNIRHPEKVFRTAMSEATASALLLFAVDAKDDILQEMRKGNFQCAYNKLNYLLQLSALKDKAFNNKIAGILQDIAQELLLVAETIHADKGILALQTLSTQLYSGILFDRLIGGNIVKIAYFNTKLLLLKLLLKQPIYQEDVIKQHVQDIHFLTIHFGERWKSVKNGTKYIHDCSFLIQGFIDDVFLKGNQIAMIPKLAQKAEKLFAELNAYLAGHQGAKYAIVTVQDLAPIAQSIQKSGQEVFDLMVKLGWLSGNPGDTEGKFSLSVETILLPEVFQCPQELSAPNIKAMILKLFSEKLMLDVFFEKKYLNFKNTLGHNKQGVTSQLFTIAENQQVDYQYRLHQFQNFISQFFELAKASKYLKFLQCLSILNEPLINKRCELLNKIIQNFQALNAKVANTSSHVPVGSVHMIPSVTIPEGFKECNGDWLLIKDYPALFHLLQDTFGSQTTPTGEKQFRLPDYRGYFLRGNVQGRFFQTSQEDTTRLPRNAQFTTSNNGSHSHNIHNAGKHDHPYLRPNESITSDCAGTYHKIFYYGPDQDGRLKEFRTPSYQGEHSHGMDSGGDHNHSITGGGDPETRPQNYPVTYMIRF